jgi:hypothetical protein
VETGHERQASRRKIDRAVEWIDDPAKIARAGDGEFFFGEYGMTGEFLQDPFDDDPFGLFVELCDRVRETLQRNFLRTFESAANDLAA